MYTLVKTTVLPLAPGSMFEEIFGASEIVNTLYQRYLKIYLELSHPALPANVYVDMDDVRNDWISWPGTLADKLLDNADQTLPTVTTIPSMQLRYAKYQDGFRAGYKVDLTDMGNERPANYPKSLLKDLQVWRPHHNANMALVDQYCLVSVNGLIHDTDSDDRYLYVRDGGKSHNHSRHNQLGIWSFMDVGRIRRVRINPDNIRAMTDGTLKDRVYIDVPDVDLDNKSYLLILGGYVVLPDGHGFVRSGEHQFSLDLKSLPYEERLHESSNYIRLDSLPLDRLSNDPQTFTLESMWSNETIVAYLTLSQSFLVVIDTPNLMFKQQYVRTTGLPGSLISYSEPKYPLMVGYGKFAEYWTSYEDGQWAMSVQDGWYRNYHLHYTPDRLRLLSNGDLDNRHPVKSSDASMLVVIGHD